MKKRANGWEAAASVVRVADRLLNGIIAIFLVVALLYGGFGLWDTWMIYKNAGVDSEILKYKPTLSADEDAPNPTLSDLQKINPDVVAWLTVDDTNIDYPVVQGETNMDYLNKAVDGSFTLTGSIFLDRRNADDFSDYYSLIYGHHIEGKVMFGEIPEFLEQEYFEEHTTGTLFLPEHTRQIQWFACIKTDAYDEYLFQPSYVDNKESMNQLLDYIRQEAVQYRDIGVTTSDQIIALSTCENASTDGRILLIGQLSAGVAADADREVGANAQTETNMDTEKNADTEANENAAVKAKTNANARANANADVRKEG
jgi:sortase B